MNPRLTIVLLLAAALGPAAYSATPDYPSPVELPVSNAVMHGAEIKPGTPGRMVTKAFGKPTQQLSADVWIYRGFHTDADYATIDLTTAKRCNILVVLFKNGQVASLKLVNNAAVEATVATLKLDRPLGNVAVGK